MMNQQQKNENCPEKFASMPGTTTNSKTLAARGTHHWAIIIIKVFRNLDRRRPSLHGWRIITVLAKSHTLVLVLLVPLFFFGLPSTHTCVLPRPDTNGRIGTPGEPCSLHHESLNES
jgi:hypothetical protein